MQSSGEVTEATIQTITNKTKDRQTMDDVVPYAVPPWGTTTDLSAAGSLLRPANCKFPPLSGEGQTRIVCLTRLRSDPVCLWANVTRYRTHGTGHRTGCHRTGHAWYHDKLRLRHRSPVTGRRLRPSHRTSDVRCQMSGT